MRSDELDTKTPAFLSFCQSTISSSIQKDPNASTEKFQRSMDEFWDEVKDDLNETRSGEEEWK